MTTRIEKMENNKITLRIDTMNPKLEVDIEANNISEVKELLDYIIVNFRQPQTSVLPDLRIEPSTSFQVSPISDKEITISASDYKTDTENSDSF